MIKIYLSAPLDIGRVKETSVDLGSEDEDVECHSYDGNNERQAEHLGMLEFRLLLLGLTSW